MQVATRINLSVCLSDMSKSKNNECVKVVVRCRPLNQKEIGQHHESVVNMDLKMGQVQIKNPKSISYN